MLYFQNNSILTYQQASFPSLPYALSHDTTVKKKEQITEVKSLLERRGKKILSLIVQVRGSYTLNIEGKIKEKQVLRYLFLTSFFQHEILER